MMCRTQSEGQGVNVQNHAIVNIDSAERQTPETFGVSDEWQGKASEQESELAAN